MLSQEIAIIANKYADDANNACNASCKLVRGEYTFTEFQSVVIDICKNKYLDIVIFDASCLPEKEVLNGVRDLKLHLPKSVRIIVIYPNLKDKIVLQQLYVYGVYDIVNPDINPDEMDDIAIANTLITQIKWAIAEPREFASVADELSVEIITQNITNVHINDEPEKPAEKKQEVSVLNKPRLLCLYAENATNFEAFENDKRYNVISVLEATEGTIAKQDLSSIDYIILDNVSLDKVSYLKSLVEVNAKPSIIVAGYDNFDAHAEVSRIRGVHAFLYDGSSANFKRCATRAFAETKKVESIPSRIYAIYGVKGGVGATTITALLASDFAKKHPSARVCVVDFNTKAGDVGVKFGISKPTKNIYQFVLAMCKSKKEHFDLSLLKDKINQFVVYDKKHKLFVLPTSYTDIYRYMDNQYSVNDIAMVYEYMIDCLKDNFDAVFIDVSKYASFTYDIAMNAANKVILVSDAKLASISHLLTKYEELNKVEGDYVLNDTYVIINRADTRRNEGEYENCKYATSKIGEKHITCLPYDKLLADEAEEMGIAYGGKFKKALGSVWTTIANKEE